MISSTPLPTTGGSGNAGMVDPWRCTLPDWRHRLMNRQSLMPALPALDRAAADRAIINYNRLRLPDVMGRPTLGEAGGSWFSELVGAVHGSLLPDGRRGIHSVLVMVPKKNNKTTGGGGFMLASALINRRPEALFGLLAPTQKIAEEGYDVAAGMVEADAGLKKIVHTKDHRKELIIRDTGAVLRIATFDPSVATGGKFAGWLLDEVHLLGGVSYAQRVVTQLRGARSAIHESFGIMITTQSDVPPAGLFKEELKFFRGVRDGTVDATGCLPLLYEYPSEMQADPAKPWLDPETWPLVHPNMGLSVNPQVLRDGFNEAMQKGDEAQRIWFSQHLNIEIGVAIGYDAWEGSSHWESAEIEPLTLDQFLDLCDCVTVGGDGGGLDDLLGLTLIGRKKDGSGWISWSRAWAFSDPVNGKGVIQRRKEIAARLQDFATAGEMRIIESLGDDVMEFADIVEQVHLRGLLPSKSGIGLDPVGVAAIVDELHAREIPTETIVGVPQGYRLSGTIKGAARKLADGTLKPMRQDMMRWCVSNAKTELRGNAVLVTKQVSGSAKIDPLVALFNAFDLMARNPEAAGGRSYLEDGEVLAA